MLTMMIFQFLFILPICILLISTPYLMRKTVSFGVSIPEELFNHTFIRSLRKRYVRNMSIVSILVVAILFIVQWIVNGHSESTAALFSTGICLLLIAGSIQYVISHQKMKRFKENSVVTEDDAHIVVVQTSFHTEKKAISNGWFFIPMCIIIATIIFTNVNEGLFPNRIPIHFNMIGEATDWIQKTEASIYFIPLIQLYMLVIFMFINMVIRTAKQKIDPKRPQQSLQQNVLFRRRWSVFLWVTGVIVISMLSFSQYSIVFHVPSSAQTIVTIVVPGFIILGSIFLAFKTGQGGNRIPVASSSSSAQITSQGDDDAHWKFGVFYVNKNDPSLFVEKRFGIGWTVNLARPLVWVIFIALIGSIVLITLLTT